MENFIRRTSLSESVTEALQEQIKSGKYKLDEQLPSEPELMKLFGVGRSSIREAIKALENAGIVRVKQGVGTFIASKTAVTEPLSKQLLSAEDAEIKEVREMLEIRIAENAAHNRTRKDITIITGNLEKRNKAADQQKLAEWLEADINFHTSVADASGNSVLAHIYKTFAEQQLRRSIGNNYSNPASMHRLTDLHQKLLDAIVAQDAAAAVKAVRAMHKKQ